MAEEIGDKAGLERLMWAAAASGGTTHMLMGSLPAWVSWVQANWSMKLDGWWQHPVIVMELDTAWRTWRAAWGPEGSARDKASWFYDFSITLGRITEHGAKAYMNAFNSPDFDPVFCTDAPSGTLGLVPDFAPQQVRVVDGVDGHVTEPGVPGEPR